MNNISRQQQYDNLKMLRDVQNGRVDIMGKSNQHQYPLYQQSNLGIDEYKEEALKGIQSDSLLSNVFFSKDNIDLIQDRIRYNVWLKSGKKHIIGRQSDTELEIVIRSIYLQYSKNLQYDIKEQIKELDDIVIDYCVPKILTEVEQYLSYKIDVSNLPKPMERPQNLSSAGAKTLVLNNFM